MLNKWEIINGMYVCSILEKSWINEQGQSDSIKEVIWKSDRPQLIQFDEATGHMNLEILDYLTSSGYHVVVTPGETSKFIQPNDQLINIFFSNILQ